MAQSQQLKKEIEAAVAEVKRLAEAGGSEARTDLVQPDGSVIVVACRAGEDPRVETIEPESDPEG
jgi:hypothetical protein